MSRLTSRKRLPESAVQWCETVVLQWRDHFQTMAVALARLATLMYNSRTYSLIEINRGRLHVLRRRGAHLLAYLVRYFHSCRRVFRASSARGYVHRYQLQNTNDNRVIRSESRRSQSEFLSGMCDNAGMRLPNNIRNRHITPSMWRRSGADISGLHVYVCI